MPEVTFTVSNTRDAVDVRWGSLYPSSQLCHIKLHPNNTRTGKAPTILYFNGGGAELRDGRLPFIANGNMNALFDRVVNSTQAPFFNLVGVTVPQHAFPFDDAAWPFTILDSLGNGHSQTASLGSQNPFWMKPRQGEFLSFPGLFEFKKLFILWFKSVAEQYGCDPDRLIVAGSSFGGQSAMLSQITAPLYSDQILQGSSVTSFEGMKGGYDSRVRGVINHYGITDVRKDPAYMALDGTFAAGTYCFPPHYISLYAGVRNKAQLDALPSYITEQLSMTWYIEQGKTEFLVPHYQLWERNGIAHSGTFGDNILYPCPDTSGHAEQYWFILERACRMAGKENTQRSTLIKPLDLLDGGAVDARAGSNGRTYAQRASDDMIDWMKAVVVGPRGGWNVPSGHGPVYWNENGYT